MSDWRQLEEFPNYSINEYGVVVNDRYDRELTTRTNFQGCVMVSPVRDRVQYTRSVSQLVAQTFVEQPDPRYNSIIHLNGDTQDCRAINLMWRPREFIYPYHKMFKNEPFRVGCYIPEIKRTFRSLREFCTTYGLIEQRTYIEMLNGEPCYHYGWILEQL